MATTAPATATHEPQYDPTIGQYVALTVTGSEVYGNTWTDCLRRLQGANECAIDHADRNPMEPDWRQLAQDAEPTSQVADAADAAGYLTW